MATVGLAIGAAVAPAPAMPDEPVLPVARWDDLQVRRGLPARPDVGEASVTVVVDDVAGRVRLPLPDDAVDVRRQIRLADVLPADLPASWTREAARAAAAAVLEHLTAEGRAAQVMVVSAEDGLDLMVVIERGPFTVRGLELVEVEPHPGRPGPTDFADLIVRLGVIRDADGRVDRYVDPPPADGGDPDVLRSSRDVVALSLGELDPATSVRCSAGALRAIVLAVRDELVARDLLGVSVAIDPSQITTNDLRDRRALTDRTLRILYTTGIVREVRSVDTGEETREAGLDRPRDRTVRERSPLQPWAGPAGPSGGEEAVRRDLLERGPLEDHLARLERLPGRRVDAAIAGASDEQGGAALEYLVRERDPLLVFTDVSNTGTEQTDEWRTRVRFDAFRPTGAEDLFALEYVTAGFDTSHLITAVYDRPLFARTAPLGPRVRLSGAWSRYSASDVGLGGEQFVGESWNVDAELSWNLVQDGELFIDVVAGLRWDDIQVDNQVGQIQGDTTLLRPRLGLRMERDTLTGRTDAFALIETNLAQVAGTRNDDLNRVGRLFAEDEWAALRFGFSHSGWLEPFFDRAAWEDLTTPGSSTLAHELRLSVRGQLAFGERLIPQAQQVAGGMFSVRGHPESVVAGDDLIIASAEYRFHVPRAMPYRPAPDTLFGRPFRFVPTEPYGGADWDLVLKVFVDAARASINDPLFFERGATLIGAGVGVEFAWKRNLRLRLDYGRVMQDVDGRDVQEGDDRLHFSGSFVF